MIGYINFITSYRLHHNIWLIQIVPDKKENADDDDRNADDGDDYGE